jgi:hypothetical protein
MTKKKWKLIDNNSHQVLEFETQKELLEYAKTKGHEIKLGKYGIKDRTYYFESYQYIPGNRP